MNIFTRLTLYTALIGLTSATISSVAIAQTTPIRGTPDTFQSNERDAFSGGIEGGFNPFNLIHNAVLGGGQSMQEFMGVQQQNLDNETDNFRRLQQERLQNYRRNGATTQPATTPAE